MEHILRVVFMGWGRLPNYTGCTDVRLIDEIGDDMLIGLVL